MHNLIVRTTEAGFQIENLPYPKLVIRYKDDEVTITPTIPGTFDLTKERLASIRKPGESIISILVPTDDGELSELNLQSFKLTAASNLFFDYEASRYFLYASQQNTLRVITDQKPSVTSYHHSHEIEKVDNGAPGTFTLSIKSKYFKLTELRVILKERSSKRSLVLHSSFQEQVELEENLYSNVFQFSISATELAELTDSNKSLTEYNYSIYDFYFNFSIKEQPLTEYQIRIGYFQDKALLEEVLDFNDDYQLIYEAYPTKQYNNLSLNAAFIPHDTLAYYQEIKRGEVSPVSSDSKKTMLFVEYPHKAQDNGLIFFKYMVKHHSNEFNLFYLITPDSKDLPNLTGYKEFLVMYKSKEHLDVLLQTDILIHTHSTTYAFPFFSSFFNTYRKKFFKVFMQHGITGLRNINSLYSKDTHESFTDLFIVSSQREKELVINELGYHNEEIAITGFARFDQLLSLKTRLEYLLAKKQLLIMPSWRKGQDHLSEKEFQQTEFFKSYTSLIQSNELKMYADRYKLNVVFYLHTNFQKYSHLFKSDFVKIIKEGKETVQDLLTMSSILITDYSSVGLDFSILKRPLIYFQFDDLPEEANYADAKTFLPGNIVETELELMDQLHAIKPGSKMEDRFIRRLPQIYAFNDRKANKRIYQEIISKINK